MQLILKILKFEFSNVLRSKWVLFFFMFFFLTSYALFSFENNTPKALLSLFNLIIYLVPLICLIFGTMYFYNSREYIEMILCQPIPRSALYIGLFAGTALPLVLSLVSGIIIPFILFGNFSEGVKLILLLVTVGSVLTLLSVAIAFLISTKITDKVKGLSISIFFWLITAIAFDGFLLLIAYLFQEYPVEKVLLALTFLNPLDLSRTLFMLNFDISALLGLTGALFKKFYGSDFGIIISSFSLVLWILLPFLIGLKSFKQKDF
ncbi:MULTISPECIES: ABC transporter permease subunit [Ignavibacterium]|uniref:ABC transporter permease subunit n=1 Tax=Ignavibacterium TaxID=795750 RepID=UPI0025C2AF6F|nr:MULTISPECIES: ABC transporter permease subunit [Ignavibacterium]MBI5661530.1 ABC transporter permease subunit [Ignavibacterium album]